MFLLTSSCAVKGNLRLHQTSLTTNAVHCMLSCSTRLQTVARFLLLSSCSHKGKGMESGYLHESCMILTAWVRLLVLYNVETGSCLAWVNVTVAIHFQCWQTVVLAVQHATYHCWSQPSLHCLPTLAKLIAILMTVEDWRVLNTQWVSLGTCWRLLALHKVTILIENPITVPLDYCAHCAINTVCVWRQS